MYKIAGMLVFGVLKNDFKKKIANLNKVEGANKKVCDSILRFIS